MDLDDNESTYSVGGTMTTERFSSVCLHVVAVLFHQFGLRDGTPERMLRVEATPDA